MSNHVQPAPSFERESRSWFKKAYVHLDVESGGNMVSPKSYKVDSFRMGSKTQGDQIVFASVEDMEQAYKDIDNGRDIYIEKDGIVTKLLQPMLTSRIYDGSIVLSARVEPSKETKEV